MLKFFSSPVLVFVSIILSACSQETVSTEKSTPKSEVASLPEVQPVKQEEKKVFDGPFGLKMGLTSAEVAKIIPSFIEKNDEKGMASADTVPVPHSEFESYSFIFSEKSGLCVISGIGKDIKSGSAGLEVKSAFDSLDDALKEKYGNGKKFDFGSDRSPEFWMLHLLQKDRFLSKYWDKTTKAKLSNNINSILIRANSVRISEGFINIRYEFENVDDCIKEQKENKNKGL